LPIPICHEAGITNASAGKEIAVSILGAVGDEKGTGGANQPNTKFPFCIELSVIDVDPIFAVSGALASSKICTDDGVTDILWGGGPSEEERNKWIAGGGIGFTRGFTGRFSSCRWWVWSPLNAGNCAGVTVALGYEEVTDGAKWQTWIWSWRRLSRRFWKVGLGSCCLNWFFRVISLG